jgi:hypothetical protein
LILLFFKLVFEKKWYEPTLGKNPKHDHAGMHRIFAKTNFSSTKSTFVSDVGSPTQCKNTCAIYNRMNNKLQTQIQVDKPACITGNATLEKVLTNLCCGVGLISWYPKSDFVKH